MMGKMNRRCHICRGLQTMNVVIYRYQKVQSIGQFSNAYVKSKFLSFQSLIHFTARHVPGKILGKIPSNTDKSFEIFGEIFL